MAIPMLALVLGAAAVLLMPLAALGYRTGLLPLQIALLQGMRWAAYLGVVAVVAGVVALFLARKRPAGRRAPLFAGLGLVLGLVAVIIPFNWQRMARSVPPIHDITTDITNPPTFQAVVPLRADAPNTLDYDPKVGEQQRTGYPDITTLALPINADAAFERALALARDAGWEIVDANREARRIEATDTTFWFGFKDDVVIRLTPEGSFTRVDMRSVSRVGRSDVGTNARRIREFLASLQAG
jgi:uncharacterized protein (DUF1499 family)